MSGGFEDLKFLNAQRAFSALIWCHRGGILWIGKYQLDRLIQVELLIVNQINYLGVHFPLCNPVCLILLYIL